jgi:hypothetical protein
MLPAPRELRVRILSAMQNAEHDYSPLLHEIGDAVRERRKIRTPDISKANREEKRVVSKFRSSGRSSRLKRFPKPSSLRSYQR